MPSAPKRHDKRIAARLETLVHLFDVPRARVEKAVKDGRIQSSSAVFGVPLFHVETVERALFGIPALGTDDGAAGHATTQTDRGVRASIAAFAAERKRAAAERVARRQRAASGVSEASGHLTATQDRTARRERDETFKRWKAERKQSARDRSERMKTAKAKKSAGDEPPD